MKYTYIVGMLIVGMNSIVYAIDYTKVLEQNKKNHFFRFLTRAANGIYFRNWSCQSLAQELLIVRQLLELNPNQVSFRHLEANLLITINLADRSQAQCKYVGFWQDFVRPQQVSKQDLCKSREHSLVLIQDSLKNVSLTDQQKRLLEEYQRLTKHIIENS